MDLLRDFLLVTANALSFRIKQATEKAKSPIIPAKDSRPGSIHASTKVLTTRRMSKKDLELVNPLLAKEVAQAVSIFVILPYFFFLY